MVAEATSGLAFTQINSKIIVHTKNVFEVVYLHDAANRQDLQPLYCYTLENKPTKKIHIIYLTKLGVDLT